MPDSPRNPPTADLSEISGSEGEALRFGTRWTSCAPTAHTRTLTHMGTITPTELPHGDRRRYVRQCCRCAPCTAANTAYHRTRNRAIARPDATWEPRHAAAEAADRIAHLRDNGLGLRRISELTGISRSTLAAIASGARNTITAETNDALRRIDPRIADGTHVDSTRARAALTALTEAGWTAANLARLAGHNTPLRVRGTRVRRCTEHRILTVAAALGAVIDDDGNTLVAPAPPSAIRA